MPSSTPPDYTRWLSEPSIVIDPGLYVDARPRPGRRLLCAGLIVLRSAAGVGVLGITLFAVVHADQWLAKGHGNAHAAERRALGQWVGAATQASPVDHRASRLAAGRAPMDGATPRVEEAPPVPAIEATPDDVLATEEVLRDTLRKARRLLNQHRLDEAEAAYSEVLDMRARHPGALAGRARVELVRGDLDRAFELAQSAVRFAPARAVYRVMLADVLRARGEPAAADLELATAERLSQKPMDRAAKLLPDNPF